MTNVDLRLALIEALCLPKHWTAEDVLEEVLHRAGDPSPGASTGLVVLRGGRAAMADV
jgi:hypothetical protein